MKYQLAQGTEFGVVLMRREVAEKEDMRSGGDSLLMPQPWGVDNRVVKYAGLPQARAEIVAVK